MVTDSSHHWWQTPAPSRLVVATAVGLALALALTLLLPGPTTTAATGCSVKNKATGRTYATLQAAANAARPKARLLVMGVCRGGTVIERTMKIIGVPTRARGLPRLTGVRRERVLDVREGARVELANLIVERGRAFRGAGIRNRGLLILRDVTVRMNTTGDVSRGHPQGAGIHNRGTLRLNGATRIVFNSTHGDCGGVANLGSMLMNGTSLVARNTPSFDLTGGVCNRRGATLVMNGTSAIRDNGERQVGNSGRFTMKGRSWVKPSPVDDDEGGPGVTNAGVFTMNDASSVRNGSYQSYGVLNLRRLVMNDRSSIRANPGGGLRNGAFELHGAVTVMSDQSSISGNSSGCRSAGVWNRATLRMSGASAITGNTAVALDVCPTPVGAGLYHEDGSLVGVRCGPAAGANVFANSPDDCYVEG